MEIIYLLLPLSLILAILGLFAFIWSVKSEQYEDLDTPDKKILFEDNSTDLALKEKS